MDQPKTERLTGHLIFAGILAAALILTLTFGLGSCGKSEPAPDATDCSAVCDCITQLQAEAMGSRTAGSGFDAVDTTHFTNVYVGGDATIAGTLDVTGDSSIDGNLHVAGTAYITTALVLTGDLTVNDITANDIGASDLTLTGNLITGNGTPSVAVTGEDAYIEGTFEVDGAAQFDGNVDLNGTELIIDADGDSILQEASDDNTTLTLGAAAGTHSILTGNFKVGNGTPGIAQDGEDAYVEGALEVDGSAYFDTNLYLGDGVWNGYVDGNLILGTDEDAVIGWFQSVIEGDHLWLYSPHFIQATVPATATLWVDTGNWAVGNGTPDVTLDGEDAYIEGTLEVDGAARFDLTFDVRGDLWDGAGDFTIADAVVITSTLSVNGATDLDGTLNVDGLATFQEDTSIASTLTVSSTGTFAGDVTVSPDTTGGNEGAKNEFVGLPRITMVGLGAGTNGTTETTSYVDDSPTGEYAPEDADVTEAEGSGDSIFKYGASSYKARFSEDASEDDGFRRTIAADDLEANESVGLLLYPSVAIASGDLKIVLKDDGGDRTFNIGALTATTWNWVEIDISSLDAGTGDTISEFGILLTSQGEAGLGAFDLYMDIAYKWDSADEEALGVALQLDGVLSVLAAPTAGGAHSVLAELTDYVVHYEDGADFLVWITDQSANTNVALVAY